MDAEAFRGDALAVWDEWRDLAVFVCERAGLRPVDDERQTWRVGGHELSVALKLGPDHRYYLSVSGWPTKPVRRGLKLGHVFAIAVTGDLRELKGPERARWKLRALVEAGLVELPEIELRPLPGDAPDAARQTWAAIGYFAAIRAIGGDTGPMGLSAPWFAGWSGLDERVVRRGKHWLERHGFISKAGEVPSGKGRPLVLWAIALAEPLATAATEAEPKAELPKELDPEPEPEWQAALERARQASETADQRVAWPDDSRPGEEGVLADCEALVASGARWVDEEVGP